MKIILKFCLAGLLVLLAIASCAREEDFAEQTSGEYSFSVMAELPDVEQEDKTKGYLGSFVSAKWKTNDEVSVVNLTEGKILQGKLVAGSEGTRTTFSGTVYGTIKTGDDIALFYPAFSNDAEVDFGSRHFSLASQPKGSGVPLLAYGKFKAGASDGSFSGLNLSFYYIWSFFKLNLANLPQSDTVSRVTVRNVPTELTLSVDGSGTGFNIATDAEKAAKGKIVLDGPYCTNSTGALMISFGAMPSDSCTTRGVQVSVKDDGDYLSPMTAARFASHKYYNTVVGDFVKISSPTMQNYGVYDFTTNAALDEYEDCASTIVAGVEDGEADFSLINSFTGKYWTLKGLPADAQEGDVFSARVYNYGVSGLSDGIISGAGVKIIEPDGDYSKLWIKAGDYLFIVRK